MATVIWVWTFIKGVPWYVPVGVGLFLFGFHSGCACEAHHLAGQPVIIQSEKSAKATRGIDRDALLAVVQGTLADGRPLGDRVTFQAIRQNDVVRGGMQHVDLEVCGTPNYVACIVREKVFGYPGACDPNPYETARAKTFNNDQTADAVDYFVWAATTDPPGPIKPVQ